MFFETVEVSEEGAIAIPMEMRIQMNLQPGEKFLLTYSGDSILLKRLVEKTQDEADAFWARVKEQRATAV